MPSKSKPEKGTPKALDKKTKAKGLKKLKWYCQMCAKQCGDQSGFKRHCESESHQRQLLLFAENQGAYLRQFSREFEANFMHIFKYTFGGKRTRANVIYQEYIRDRGHVHMNATVWHTLGGFVRYLGETGKCKIDEDEKGWHIQYIDKEDEIRKQKLSERVKQEKTDDDRMTELLQRQIERGQLKADEERNEIELKEFIRESEDQKVKFTLGSTRLIKNNLLLPSPSTSAMTVKPGIIKQESYEGNSDKVKQEDCDVKPSKTSLDHQFHDVKPKKIKPNDKKRSALEELIEEEEHFKERKNRKNYWLHRGIIVKVVSKKASDKFYKSKGEVTKVIDKYTAEITLPTGEVETFDQDQLETVIPALGRDMLIVNGAYRGEIAELKEIDETKFSLRLRISEGPLNGRIVELPYEDASKLV